MALAGAAAGLAAVGVISAGTALASANPHHGHIQAYHHAHTAVASQARQARARQAASSKAPGATPAPKPYGAVIGTGIRNSSGELVFYGVHVHVRQLPEITFGFMGGYRNAAGQLSADVEVNEFSGSDVAPGFHAVEAPTTVNGQAVTEFGYYAGPAVKITGTVGGNTVQADQAQWSVNPRIVVFWFSPQADPSGADVAGLAAFNAQGQPLPAGHNTVGHG
jgi:hypothetical protein